jgi:hypothetical protein
LLPLLDALQVERVLAAQLQHFLPLRHVGVIQNVKAYSADGRLVFFQEIGRWWLLGCWFLRRWSSHV